MAEGLYHPFASAVADGADTTLVQPSDWNAKHSAPDGAILGKVYMTAEGGIAVRLTNKTGANSVKGSLVSASTGTDNAFGLQSNELDTFGVVYESGIADGQECWVVVAGRCQVLMKDTVAATRGQVLIAADTDGRATFASVPPVDATHWKECGHFIESKTAGTNVLAYAVVHFN